MNLRRSHVFILWSLSLTMVSSTPLFFPSSSGQSQVKPSYGPPKPSYNAPIETYGPPAPSYQPKPSYYPQEQDVSLGFKPPKFELPELPKLKLPKIPKPQLPKLEFRNTLQNKKLLVKNILQLLDQNCTNGVDSLKQNPFLRIDHSFTFSILQIC